MILPPSKCKKEKMGKSFSEHGPAFGAKNPIVDAIKNIKTLLSKNGAERAKQVLMIEIEEEDKKKKKKDDEEEDDGRVARPVKVTGTY